MNDPNDRVGGGHPGADGGVRARGAFPLAPRLQAGDRGLGAGGLHLRSLQGGSLYAALPVERRGAGRQDRGADQPSRQPRRHVRSPSS